MKKPQFESPAMVKYCRQLGMLKISQGHRVKKGPGSVAYQVANTLDSAAMSLELLSTLELVHGLHIT